MEITRQAAPLFGMNVASGWGFCRETAEQSKLDGACMAVVCWTPMAADIYPSGVLCE
jgi:hypothetical protein